MVEFKEVKAKTVLNRYKYRDNWFWCRYSINPYAAWASHKAAQNIEELKESIQDIRNKNALEQISGVGKSLARIIREFLDTGKCEKLERLRTEW